MTQTDIEKWAEKICRAALSEPTTNIDRKKSSDVLSAFAAEIIKEERTEMLSLYPAITCRQD